MKLPGARRSRLSQGRIIACARLVSIGLVVQALTAPAGPVAATRAARERGDSFDVLQRLVEIPRVSSRAEDGRGAIRQLPSALGPAAVDPSRHLPAAAGARQGRT